MLSSGIKPYWLAPDDSLVLCILLAVLLLHKPLAMAMLTVQWKDWL